MSPNVLLDPCLTLLEPPPCPKCHRPMMLTDVTVGRVGFHTRTFYCVMCNYSVKVPVEEAKCASR
jgi:hypothetical protein